MLAALLDAGIAATGVDSSADMLSRARALLGTTADLVQQDVRARRLASHFRTIVIALDSFGLLLSCALLGALVADLVVTPACCALLLLPRVARS